MELIPKIYFTNDECIVNGINRPGIGLLLDHRYKPIIEPTLFLIDASITKKERESSVREYGRILRMYWEYLEKEKIDWQSVDDNILVKWRDMMYSGQRISKGQINKNDKCLVDECTINLRLGVVFKFYKWAKDNKLAPNYIIGIAGDNQCYSITAKLIKNGWSWPYLLKTPPLPPPNIPNKDDIGMLHEAFDLLLQDQHASRNRLIASWMEYSGMRGIEIASLKVKMIPDYDEIQSLIENEKHYELDFSPKRKGVRTKGGKSRFIDVDPILVEITRDYIENERKEIVERAKKLAEKKGTIYTEPDEIMLNLLNGRPLSKKTFQNTFSIIIKKYGLRMKTHDLRKYYAMKIVTDLYFSELRRVEGDVRKVDTNTIILHAQQRLGHSRASTTIANYINIVKLKYVTMSDENKAMLLNRRISIVEKQLEAAQRKLIEARNMIFKIDGLKDAVAKNDKDKVMNYLKTII